MSRRERKGGKRRSRALAGLDTSLVEYEHPVGSYQLDGRTTRSGTYARTDQPEPERNSMVVPARSWDKNHQARDSAPRFGPNSRPARPETRFRVQVTPARAQVPQVRVSQMAVVVKPS